MARGPAAGPLASRAAGRAHTDPDYGLPARRQPGITLALLTPSSTASQVRPLAELQRRR